jgi:hypothetical protein
MILSHSGPLTAVVDAMRQGLELDPGQVMVDGLKRFLTLWETEPEPAENEKPVAELLYDLAVSPHWYIVMASLRTGRDYARDEEPVVADLLKLWNEKIARQTIHSVLLKPGHLSRAPKKLIKLAWEYRELFAEARKNIAEHIREKDPDDERKQVAGSVFLLFEKKAPTYIEDIRADLKVLATVAKHFIDVRKFAKFDGFVYNWPEISQLGRANFDALKHVEDLLRSRAPRPSDADLDARGARELYSLIEKNDRLKAFLRLRPYFSEINENELMSYRRLVPASATSGRPGSSMLESVQPQPPPPQPPEPGAPQPSTTHTRQIQTLTLQQAQDTHPSPHEDLTYDLSFSWLGKTLTAAVRLRVDNFLGKILGGMGVSSDSGLQEILKELFAGDPSFAEERIRRGSIELATGILPYGTEPLSEVLATPASLRLVVNSTEREIHYLPWEWWPTSQSRLLLSSPDHSVVRRAFQSPTRDLPPPMFAPLRLMSVIVDDPPTGIRSTSEFTLRALEELAAAPNVQYRAVVHDEARWNNLPRVLEDFRPHIVHFEGFWIVSSQQMTEADPSVYQNTRVNFSDHFPSIGEFSAELKKNGVQLLVIGRNGASTIYENSTATAAFELAQNGLSVIAPMRGIDDTSATTFATEFYRAFLAGNKLESALHLARRTLASKGGDWTAFAFFTDPDRLEYLELIRESS